MLLYFSFSQMSCILPAVRNDPNSHVLVHFWAADLYPLCPQTCFFVLLPLIAKVKKAKDVPKKYSLIWTHMIYADKQPSFTTLSLAYLPKMSRSTRSTLPASAFQNPCWQHSVLSAICTSSVISENIIPRHLSAWELWEGKRDFYIKLANKISQNCMTEVSRKAEGV